MWGGKRVGGLWEKSRAIAGGEMRPRILHPNPRGITTSWWELRTIVNRDGVEVAKDRSKHRNEELEDSVV